LNSSTTYYSQGQSHLRAGKLAEARNACKKALELNPRMIEAQQLIAMIDDILAFGNRQMYNV
jgi:Tfp pilus assembly protein PilF